MADISNKLALGAACGQCHISCLLEFFGSLFDDGFEVSV